MAAAAEEGRAGEAPRLLVAKAGLPTPKAGRFRSPETGVRAEDRAGAEIGVCILALLNPGVNVFDGAIPDDVVGVSLIGAVNCVWGVTAAAATAAVESPLGVEQLGMGEVSSGGVELFMVSSSSSCDASFHIWVALASAVADETI